MMSTRTLPLFLVAFVTTASVAAAQGTWIDSGSLLSPRVQVAATALHDGRILIVGGATGSPPAPVASEVFDPATGTSVAVPMLNPRFFAGAVTLNDGRALVVGGQIGNSFVTTAELFDPTTNTWTFAASPAFGATPPAVLLLGDGRVFYGMNGPPQLYDPVTNAWTTLANTTQFHLSGLTLQLNDGRILMAGGLSSSDTEIYDPAANSWTTVAPMPLWLFGMRGVVLPDGRLFVSGGTARLTFTASAASFLYDPVTNTWTSAGAMSTARRNHSVSLLPNGQILVAGGTGDLAAIEAASAELYTPSTNSWSSASTMPVARSSHVAIPIGDAIYFFGGRDTSTVYSYIRNRVPTANAGTDVAADGCPTCLSAIALSGAASTDPDGDPLVYRWTIGATLLAEATTPTTIVALPVGVHTVTLTVRDGLGAEASDTVNISVVDVQAALLAQVTALQIQVSDLHSQLAGLQMALASCQASTANVGGTLNGFGTQLGSLFGNSSFAVPGATTEEQLQNLLNAVMGLPKGQLQRVYRALGGR